MRHGVGRTFLFFFESPNGRVLSTDYARAVPTGTSLIKISGSSPEYYRNAP